MLWTKRDKAQLTNIISEFSFSSPKFQSCCFAQWFLGYFATKIPTPQQCHASLRLINLDLIIWIWNRLTSIYELVKLLNIVIHDTSFKQQSWVSRQPCSQNCPYMILVLGKIERNTLKLEGSSEMAAIIASSPSKTSAGPVE